MNSLRVSYTAWSLTICFESELNISTAISCWICFTQQAARRRRLKNFAAYLMPVSLCVALRTVPKFPLQKKHQTKLKNCFTRGFRRRKHAWNGLATDFMSDTLWFIRELSRCCVSLNKLCLTRAAMSRFTQISPFMLPQKLSLTLISHFHQQWNRFHPKTFSSKPFMNTLCWTSWRELNHTPNAPIWHRIVPANHPIYITSHSLPSVFEV